MYGKEHREPATAAGSSQRTAEGGQCAQPSGEEWLQAARSDDLSYAGWMEAHGYSVKMIATILARRAQATETLGLFEDDPYATHLAPPG